MSTGKYIVLGGGMVAGYAAKALSEHGLRSGELTIVSADDAPPYERPPLSKTFLAGKDNEDAILVNKLGWYEKQGITLKLRTIISNVDLEKRELRAASGEVLQYENLLIATGSRARRLGCPGDDLPGIFYLRSIDDSRRIREKAASAKQAVVIGGGFIGMEVASVLAQKGVDTTMVIREDRVWSRVFTPAMSDFFEKYYLARGVKLLKKEIVASLEHRDRLEVKLASGRKLSCDMAVAGVGAVPVTELFAESRLKIENGIAVNEYLETNCPGVYAAGDVANYMDRIFEKRRRVEHWDNAVSQAQHWASLISGERRPFVHVPYFFSDIFDLSYELWGDAEGSSQVITRGDLKSTSFSVWWLKGTRLVAAFTMNRPDEERQAAQEWIQSKKPISTERLQDQTRDIGHAA